MQTDDLLSQLEQFQKRMGAFYAGVHLKLYSDGSGMIACERPGCFGETSEIDFSNLEELSLLLCPRPKKKSGTSKPKKPSTSA